VADRTRTVSTCAVQCCTSFGDLLQSIGVAVAGGLIWYNQDDPRWELADPICTFVFSIVVLLTTRSILRDIIHVLMERTPHHMDSTGRGQSEWQWAQLSACGPVTTKDVAGLGLLWQWQTTVGG